MLDQSDKHRPLMSRTASQEDKNRGPKNGQDILPVFDGLEYPKGGAHGNFVLRCKEPGVFRFQQNQKALLARQSKLR